MHIAPFDNKNRAIIEMHDQHVPLTYFNIVKLARGERFEYTTPVAKPALFRPLAKLIWLLLIKP